MEKEVERLSRLLNEIEQLDMFSSSSSKVDELFNEICRLTFEEEVYKNVWSERILNHLQRLFEKHSPDRETFAQELKRN